MRESTARVGRPPGGRYAGTVGALVLLGAFAGGLLLQRTERGARVRDLVWVGYFWAVSPALVLVTFVDVRVDRGLVLAMAAAILATWLVAAAGFGFSRLVSHERDEQGALVLATGWANTGFLGFPIAQLLFGAPGLALAVLYDRLSWLLPASSVSVTVARFHGRRAASTSRSRRRLRALLANPPLLAMVAAVALRAGGAGLPWASTLETASAALVGPSGFLLLGLSLTLEPVRHEAGELGRAGGALLIRFLGGPLALYAFGRLLGADVPGVFYLLAAMPPAFHLLVLARVYDVRPKLTRLLVVGATVPAVAVAAVVAVLH